MKTILLSFICIVMFVACAMAQCPAVPSSPVPLPKNVCFSPSPDHAQFDGYKLVVKKADGTQLSSTDIGKPTPVNGVISVANFTGFNGLTSTQCSSAAPCTLTTVAYLGSTDVPDGNSNGFFSLAAPGTAVVTP